MDEFEHCTYVQKLHIRNFALVESQTLTLNPGLVSITGESGAGKTVLISSIDVLLGGQINESVLLDNTKPSVVEGNFRLSQDSRSIIGQFLQNLGLPNELVNKTNYLGQLTLRREILANQQQGKQHIRSRCFVNGGATTLKVLKELGQMLADINSQHASLTMKDTDTQLVLLDKIAGTQNLATIFNQKLNEYEALSKRLRELQNIGDLDERVNMQKLIDNVEKLRLKGEEEFEIQNYLDSLEARKQAAGQCQQLSSILCSNSDEGGGLMYILKQAELMADNLSTKQASAKKKTNSSTTMGGRQVGGQVKAKRGESQGAEEEDNEDIGDQEENELNRSAETIQGLLIDVKSLIDDVNIETQKYFELCDFDKVDYERAQKKLRFIKRMMKEQNVLSVQALIERARSYNLKLEQWEDLEQYQDIWQEQQNNIQVELRNIGIKLSKQRRHAAAQLRQCVETCMQQLAMQNSRFDVRISWEKAQDQHQMDIYIEKPEAAEAYEIGDQRYQVKKSGLDVIEFLLASGPYEPLRPLSGVASGGESARVMLSLKAAPAMAIDLNINLQKQGIDQKFQDKQSEKQNNQYDETSSEFGSLTIDEIDGSQITYKMNREGIGTFGESNNVFADFQLGELGKPILVFDELDSGVGARLGKPMGTVLRQMCGVQRGALANQILCITHLPQVAAIAQHHIKVSKFFDDEGKVRIKIEKLENANSRATEIADMLGLEIQQAQKMLAELQGWDIKQFSQNSSNSVASGSSDQQKQLQQIQQEGNKESESSKQNYMVQENQYVQSSPQVNNGHVDNKSQEISQGQTLDNDQFKLEARNDQANSQIQRQDSLDQQVKKIQAQNELQIQESQKYSNSLQIDQQRKVDSLIDEKEQDTNKQDNFVAQQFDSRGQVSYQIHELQVQRKEIENQLQEKEMQQKQAYLSNQNQDSLFDIQEGIQQNRFKIQQILLKLKDLQKQNQQPQNQSIDTDIYNKSTLSGSMQKGSQESFRDQTYNNYEEKDKQNLQISSQQENLKKNTQISTQNQSLQKEQDYNEETMQVKNDVNQQHIPQNDLLEFIHVANNDSFKDSELHIDQNESNNESEEDLITKDEKSNQKQISSINQQNQNSQDFAHTIVAELEVQDSIQEQSKAQNSLSDLQNQQVNRNINKLDNDSRQTHEVHLNEDSQISGLKHKNLQVPYLQSQGDSYTNTSTDDVDIKTKQIENKQHQNQTYQNNSTSQNKEQKEKDEQFLRLQQSLYQENEPSKQRYLQQFKQEQQYQRKQHVQ